MELVIVIVVLAVAVWFFVFRQKNIVKEAISPAPYKVEASVAEKETVSTVSVPEVSPQPAVEVKTEVKAKKQTFAKKAPKSPAKAEVAAKRTRKGGKFVGDDKSTTGVNEAFKDGKSPKKPKMSVAK